MAHLGSTFAMLYKNFIMNKWMLLIAILVNLQLAFSFASRDKIFLLNIAMIFSALVDSLLIMTYNTYLLVEDKANRFKIIYKVMGLRRNQYFFGGILSALALSLTIQASLQVIIMSYRSYYKLPFELGLNEGRIILVSFFYYLLMIFVSTSFSYAFQKLETAKVVSGLVFPLAFYYTIYVVLLESGGITQFISPFYEMVEYGRLMFQEILKPVQEVVPIEALLTRILLKTVFWAFLAWYLENVVSYEDDHGKHPLFFLRWLLGDRLGRQETAPLADQEINLNHSAENTVQVRYLSKQFGQFMALKDVNVDLRAGDINCLLGHNGAGKSTFINILIGMYKATSGRMTWRDKDLVRMHHEESQELSIGICPPTNVLWDQMTVFQHLRMMCMIRGVANPQETIYGLVSMFGLEPYINFSSKELSGGNKRKLTIAMALVGDPQILLFDEPTSALDPVARKDVWDILASIRQSSPNRIILLTTHHLEEAERLADNIIFLAGGTVKLVGSVEELKRNFGLGYLVEINFTEHQNPQTLRQLKQSIESKIGDGFVFGPNESAIEDRKLELKIGLHEKTKAMAIFHAIKQTVPADAHVSIGTNTLERAYIEIDKTLNQDAIFSDERRLNDILDRLYKPARVPPAGRTLWLIMLNKLLFLSHNVIQILTMATQYVITAATMGLGLYIIRAKNIPITFDILVAFFNILALLEVVMSNYSVFNLVADSYRNIRQVIQASKVSPVVYFLAKILVDLVLQAIIYAILFGSFYYLIRNDFQNSTLKSTFLSLTVALFAWKTAFFCIGLILYSVFSAPKRATYYFAPLYLFNYFFWGIMAKLFTPALGYLSDYYAYSSLILVRSPEELDLLKIVLVFGGYSLVYFVIAMVIENYGMLANFRNDPFGEKARMVPAGGDVVHTGDAFHELQIELQNTVAEEETRTFDSTPKKLKVTNLKKRYAFKQNFAVNDVTFCVPHRVNFGLIGPNGAGKSTVFNIILSKIVKTSGNVWMDKTPNYHLFSPICNTGTPYNYNNYGIVFQDDSIWEEMKVHHNLDFFAHLHQVDQAALNELLVYFEFQHYLEKAAGDLSSGNKRKLCILISLLGNPDFMLFDEATCGVDINMRLRMRNIVAYFKERNNSASVFTTHFLKDIEIFCDKIGIIDQGQFLCVEDLNTLKRTLGGYLTTLHFAAADRIPEVVAQLGLHAKVKVVHQDQEHHAVKAILSGIQDIFGLFFYCIELKNQGILKDFSMNQLSIEDIYLDVFNRSE